MNSSYQFETPENIRVEYASAGLGTRFLAWLVDQIILTILMILVSIVLVAAAGSYFVALSEVFDENSLDKTFFLYFFGILVMVWGLGSFAYFGFLEMFMRGQTIGKRMVAIRVVTVDGFQLDPSGILIRNLFRVLDQIPILWIVPLVSKQGQRTGDLVAGTLVIADEAQQLSTVRKQLARRLAADAEFRFDHSKLKQLSSNDFEVMEQVLDRSGELPDQQRLKLFDSLTRTFATKMEIERPAPSQWQQWLEDLLAAEFRRQERSLG